MRETLWGRPSLFVVCQVMSHGPDEGPWLTSGDEKPASTRNTGFSLFFSGVTGLSLSAVFLTLRSSWNSYEQTEIGASQGRNCRLG